MLSGIQVYQCKKGIWRYRVRPLLATDGTFISSGISGTPGVDRWKGLENTKGIARRCAIQHIESERKRWEESKIVKAPTFDEFWPTYLEYCLKEKHNSPSQIDSKESIWKLYVKPFWGSVHLDKVTLAQISSFRAELAKQGSAAQSMNNRLNVLRNILNVARKTGLIQSFPHIEKITSLKELREPTFFTREEVEAFLLAAAGNQELYLAVLIAVDAGLRRGEIMALRASDLDFQERTIHVRYSLYDGELKTPKSGRRRDVVMTDRLYKALKAYPAIGKGFLFLNENGQPYRSSFMRKAFDAALLKAGLAPQEDESSDDDEDEEPSVGWHTLRHTYCTDLLKSGATPEECRRLMGHVDLKTTQRYLHATQEDLRAAVSKLGR
jgi:integrase